MMRLLLMDCCGVEGSIALADTGLGDTAPDQRVVAAEVLPGRTSSERLVPAVRQMLASRGWLLQDLAAIAVVLGPGSFTGVRVGLSAAKGLSEASGVPLIGVSRLAVLAAAAGLNQGRVHAVLDAGRGEFYYGEYVGRECVREALLRGEEVLAAVAGGMVVACESKVVEALGGGHPLVVREPEAADVLPLAVERLERGALDDAAVLDANYLRRTDFELLAKLAAERRAE